MIEAHAVLKPCKTVAHGCLLEGLGFQCYTADKSCQRKLPYIPFFLKTTVQLIGIAVMLAIAVPAGFAAGIDTALADKIISWAMIITTVYSGIEYIIKNADILSDK